MIKADLKYTNIPTGKKHSVAGEVLTDCILFIYFEYLEFFKDAIVSVP